MKQLTYSSMAAARLRANKRSYGSLVLGIFLSIFLVTTLCLCLQGVCLARIEQKNRQVGYLDVFDLDNPDWTDESIANLALFDPIGHVTVVGEVTGANLALGFADETGYDLINYRVIEGRMPEEDGEIAMEQSALLSLDTAYQLGDTVPLTVTPVDGLEETRSFTLVGILYEKTQYLVPSYGFGVNSSSVVTQFPAILLCPQEPAFATGRLAVHRVMNLKPGQSLQEAVRTCIQASGYGRLYFINPSGMVLDALDNSLAMSMGLSEEFILLLFMVVLLAVSLLTGCCVGIGTSMEGLLSKRSEEIGILRAVGATKRQIRRIFGRESLILALVTAPAAILFGCACTVVLQWRMPEQIRFRANPWLLLPIGLISVAMVLLSSRVPLGRAANKMPMSVLRDTELLRKTKHLRSKSTFRMPRLLALRRLRLHPTRQLGALFLVTLMLLGAGVLLAVMGVSVNAFSPESPAFSVYLPYDAGMADYISVVPVHTMTWQNVVRIGSLPGVERTEVHCQQDVTLLTEGDSSYFGSSNGDPDWYGSVQAFLETDLGLQSGATLTAYDLSVDSKLANSILDGKVDLDALNSGQEVIVYAPTIWGYQNTDGTGYSYAGREKQNAQDVLLATNDYFYAGQTLHLAQLCVTDNASFSYSDTIDLSTADCRQVSVTVGAVVEDISEYVGISDYAILTTPQGLRNLGLYSAGIREVEIYLNGAVDEEAEAELEQSIAAIARRSYDVLVDNHMELARQDAAVRNQLLLLFGSVTLIFFTVAVGLIVSGVTRQIQADQRTIGMLRAVGADEKAILGCYSAPITLNIILALIAAGGLLALFFAATDLRVSKEMAILMPAGMLAFAASCALVCQGILRLRIREIVSKSIIDNIREL